MIDDRPVQRKKLREELAELKNAWRIFRLSFNCELSPDVALRRPLFRIVLNGSSLSGEFEK